MLRLCTHVVPQRVRKIQKSRRDVPLFSIMARLGRRGFLAVAVVFHIIYAMSIFDIYFVSPIVSGMRAFGVNAPEAPAKRLVLYVGKIY